MENLAWSFPTIKYIDWKKLMWSDGKKKENEKKLRRNEKTLHGFNKYKVMPHLDLATLVAIFPSRIV